MVCSGVCLRPPLFDPRASDVRRVAAGQFQDESTPYVDCDLLKFGIASPEELVGERARGETKVTAKANPQSLQELRGFGLGWEPQVRAAVGTVRHAARSRSSE